MCVCVSVSASMSISVSMCVCVCVCVCAAGYNELVQHWITNKCVLIFLHKRGKVSYVSSSIYPYKVATICRLPEKNWALFSEKDLFFAIRRLPKSPMCLFLRLPTSDGYGVATNSRLLKIIGLFGRI